MRHGELVLLSSLGQREQRRAISLPCMCVMTLSEHDKRLQKDQSSVTTNTDNDLAFY